MRPTPALRNPLNRWDDHPFIVIWEVTRSCALACRHCRAEAQPRRDPRELSTEEGKALIDQVARATPGYFILTGGDPMMRPDLLELVTYARAKGLEVALSPSATPKFLNADLKGLHDAGIHRLSLSLDGASRETHDAFRGVPGTWDWTRRALDACREHGLDFQINTTLTRQNLGEFDRFVELMEKIRPAMWNLFLLVPTGRGKNADLLDGPELEALFGRLWKLSRQVPYKIKTTEGQHYRRVAWQHWRQEQAGPPPMLGNTNDGKGFVFVSHTGDVCPSGFLPMSAGNVREGELIDLYRTSPLLQALRDPARLKGKCGRCEWNLVCGGSRARSYAMTGDYLASEPLCVYQPHSNPAPPPGAVAHPGKLLENPLSICPATHNDIPELLAVQKLAFQEEADRYGSRGILPLLETEAECAEAFGKNLVLKGTVHGKLVASIRGEMDHQGICYVGRLSIHPDYQNRGYGRAMLAALEKAFPQCAAFELFTGSRSVKNLHLYESAGYGRAGSRLSPDGVEVVTLRRENQQLTLSHPQFQ